MSIDINLVELMADPENCAFDQKCKFGYRVEWHSIYCHSSDPNSPRKCRRSWYTGNEIKDEDCPFYEERKN